MSFTQLSAFHAVAAAGSVGRGAERLMVSQPAVSKQVRELERSLGVTLFDRTPKGVRPTDAGDLLADYARRIFSLVDEAEQAVADLRGLRRGRLAIAASPTMAVYVLPELLVRFRRAYSQVAVSAEVENAAVLQRRLIDGEVEMGFSEVRPERTEIDVRVILHDQLIAIASPTYRLIASGRSRASNATRPASLPAAVARARRSTSRRTISLAELSREPFIVRETGSTTKSSVERALAERGLRIEPAMSLGSTEAIKHAVAAGLGVAIVSRLAAGPELATGRLVQVDVRGLPIRRPIYQLRLRNRRPSAAAMAFASMVSRLKTDEKVI